MKVGLVGYSQSGKSTLFQLLTGTAPDPAAAMKGQIGIAKVADDRLDFLSNMFQPKKTTPATVEFVDTPGLIRGQKADNAHRIATLRGADGLLVVIDGFSGTEPADKQLAAFREELLFADLEVVSNRIAKLEAGSKKPRPAAIREQEEKELGEMRAAAASLESGHSVKDIEFSDETAKIVRGFQLFTSKPEMVVVNQSDDRAGAAPPPELLALCPNVITTSAKLELDLLALEGEDREIFMQEMGITEFAKDRVIRMAYEAVGLVSFFTVGEDECKAWTIRVGTPAIEAAGKIHSDIARGFIRAEVSAYDDLVALGSMKEIKAQGKHRLEGKEYTVADGDIINFRFSV